MNIHIRPLIFSNTPSNQPSNIFSYPSVPLCLGVLQAGGIAFSPGLSSGKTAAMKVGGLGGGGGRVSLDVIPERIADIPSTLTLTLTLNLPAITLTLTYPTNKTPSLPVPPTLFSCPALPQVLGMGTLDKVWLQFPYVFWDTEVRVRSSPLPASTTTCPYPNTPPYPHWTLTLTLPYPPHIRYTQIQSIACINYDLSLPEHTTLPSLDSHTNSSLSPTHPLHPDPVHCLHQLRPVLTRTHHLTLTGLSH